jgi:hypothetical protein
LANKKIGSLAGFNLVYYFGDTTMSLFQGAGLSFISTIPPTVTIFETGPTPVEIVQAGSPCALKIDWEVHGTLAPILPFARWEVSVKLEGWGTASESNIGPIIVPGSSIAPTIAGPNVYTTGVTLLPPQAVGAYKPIVLIQLFIGTSPLPVAGYVEAPLIQFFA